MGKKTPPPKPPDLKPITDAQLQIAKDANDIAREQMGLSREQYAWFKENAQAELELARTQADRLFEFQNKAFESDKEAKEFARQVGQTQIDAMNLQMDYAKEDRQRYEDVFRPMEDKYIAEANAFDTPERREAEAARAMTDVQRQVEAQRGNADARLRSMGVDPSQVRSTSMANQMAVAAGANQAMSGNAARNYVEDKGRALRADALNIGKGLPAQAAMGFQGAGASGAGAIGAGQAGQQAQLGAIQGGAGVGGTAMGYRSGALSNVAALTGSPMQWAQMGGSFMNQAMSGYGQAANTINSGYQNEMQSWKAGQEQAQQQFNNIMSVASVAGGMMMAEGGEVTPRRMSAGGLLGAMGGIGGAVGAAAGGKAGPSKLDQWRQRAAQLRTESDQYIRAGQGGGSGGALSMGDRFDNGAAAGSSYQPTNVWEGQTDPQYQPMPVPQTRFSEGSGPRAIPVRQARDKYQALLTEGEYVVPADVVRSKGIEFFDKLVNKYHRENS